MKLLSLFKADACRVVAERQGASDTIHRGVEGVFIAQSAPESGSDSNFPSLILFFKRGRQFFKSLVHEGHGLLMPLNNQGLKREEVANGTATAEARESAVNAADPGDAIDFSDSTGGWFKIAPFGVFAGRTPGRPQHVTPEGAGRMVGEFNSTLGKLGRMFRGIPIYHGHPDVDPEIWPDDRRLGKIVELEARADGLWGRAEWNSLGLDNKEQGFWIYPSPRWDAAKGSARFEPDRLISIGLTNTPRIQESDPVFNSDTPTNMDPMKLHEALGLPPEATDEEVFAKITALNDAATEAETRQAEMDNAKSATDAAKAEAETAKTAATTAETEAAEMKAKKEEAENSLTTERAARNAAELDLALAQGRITKAERATWEAKLTGEKREEELNSLHALTPKFPAGKPLDVGGRREARGKADSKREEVVNATHKLMEDEKIDYDAAWGRVKKDARFSDYFAGQEG